ncbi:MAG: ABC transporter permease subunit [Idiomarina sp.]|nr:ABC transporter permease subunit [Idiomarina sp.]
MTESVATPQGRRQASRLPDATVRAKRRRIRTFKDKLSRFGITSAGYGVVFSLALIFIYLFYEVLPILRGATVEATVEYSIPGLAEDATVKHLVMERFQELGVNYASDGLVTFFELPTSEIRFQESITVPDDAEITSFAAAENIGALVSYGLSNGQALILRHEYQLTFPDDVRHITPRIARPYGDSPVQIDADGQSLKMLALQESTRGQRRAMAVAYTDDRRLVAASMTTRANLFTGAVDTQVTRTTLPQMSSEPVQILIDKEFRSVFVADKRGRIHYYDISNFNAPELTHIVDAGRGARITAMEFLVGSVSIIVGTERGELSQWFLVRDDVNEYTLEKIRSFKPHAGAITRISPEYTRKGFIAGDATGKVGIHYGTSSRTLLQKQLHESAIANMAISPVNRGLLTVSENNTLTVSEVWNQHPQISFRALWNRVWYEGRANPEYIWQSSSASDEFESKFSLIPLSVGTLKAAFFAMMFAMPLGIMAAIYTAYFMTPKLRGVVKPTIEIMEALPTVILGFLAGLWLAPFMENNLPAVFSILLGMPIMMLLMALLWRNFPASIRNRVPPGWEAVLLIPIVVVFGWVAVSASPWMEIVFFDGSMRQWLTENGITYDQRNALVVGVAMGFAVIPTIYSIAEDAVFNVPKHLTQGSLALGATPWQTVVGVVLPTASPGIFSAIMIGFGRAVGETMIVLMATGNSPIVNFNIFEGMRTLSANIAVELPETAVGSSHFRILFLAALVLFTFTFILNTIAEVVRQRLRARYSNL